jgi:hypothetical protein
MIRGAIALLVASLPVMGLGLYCLVAIGACDTVCHSAR